MLPTSGYKLCLWISLTIISLSTAFQFCESSEVEDRDWCFALKGQHNVTSDRVDAYITISVRFPREAGWLGVGTGYIMHESFMFIMYPSRSTGSAVVSPRTTKFHDQPREVSDGSVDVRVADTSIDADGYHVAQFVCYGCELERREHTASSNARPWIWAYNNFQEADTDDIDKSLIRHQFFDFFYTEKNVQTNEHSDGGVFPTITPERACIDADMDSEFLRKAPSNGFLLHGALMALTCGVFIPLGVLSRFSKSIGLVASHQVIGYVSVVGGISGMGIALVQSWRLSMSFFGTHQSLGYVFGCTLLAQPWIGRLRSLQKQQHGKSVHQTPESMLQGSKLGLYHRWLGVVSYAGGAINVVMGLHFRHGWRYILPWVSLIIIEAIVYAFHRRSKQELHPINEEQKFEYRQVATEEN